MQKKLKILFVLQTPWGTGLGMSKVHHDLKEAFEKKGHQVDYLDYHKLYPHGEGLCTHLFGKNTQERILDYLKKYAYKYDVIDANQRCVPYPKQSFGFRGLLVYRSHGLPPLYRIAENQPQYRKMDTPHHEHTPESFKTKLGNLRRCLTSGAGEWAIWDSIRYADMVHVLNGAEYDYLNAYGIPEQKLALIANGLSDDYIDSGKANLKDIEQRAELSFVGSWSARKGIVHLPYIVERVDKNCRQVNLLGTGAAESIIKQDFSAKAQQRLHIQPHFNAGELGALLHRTKLGIFPSYVEGFGLAIIEQLALGIPVVAFDIPGPHDILAPIDPGLLISLGDEVAFSEKVNEILDMPFPAYRELCNRCYQRALDFKNTAIAQQLMDMYQTKLEDREA